MKSNKILMFCHVVMFLGILFPAITARAQQIIIDKPVKAGELTLFPEMGNEHVYYYLPDKLRLATDANGKPQFSFIKYVENVRSAPGTEDIREGTGGGIVHFVISLSVTPDQLSEAKNELRQIDPQGTVKGPVIYSGGTVSVISSFTNTEGNLTTQVVGIGNAPLIDGEKAAVSMELTKKGAKLLWESFKMPTPDISFSFEMELKGYRAPKKAIIKANFDKIYSHHSFDVGATGSYGKIMFGGEIELAFDDLRNNGGIEIINMGSDADMDKLIETAYNKLTTMMFNPVGTGNPAVEALMKSITGKKSALERATELYKMENKKSGSGGTKTNSGSKPKTKPKPPKGKKTSYFNTDYFNEGPLLASIDKSYIPVFSVRQSKTDGQDEWKPKPIKDVIKDYFNLLSLNDEELTSQLLKLKNDEFIYYSKILDKSDKNPAYADKPKEYYRQYLLSDEEKRKFSDILTGKKEPDAEFTSLIKSRIIAIILHQDYLNDKQKELIISTIEPNSGRGIDGAIILTYIAWINKNGLKHIPKLEQPAKIVKELYSLRSTAASENVQNTSSAADTSKNKTNTEQPHKQSGKKNTKNGQTKPGTGNTLGGASAVTTPHKPSTGNKNKTGTKEKKSATDFKMAVMATYQFKRIRQRGNFKIDLNKYTADKLLLRFDENIGKVNCEECFKEVNLDDPMFKQREIVAILDGFNYDDFGKYINYVNLKLKKKHQNGDLTVDEVRIDRENFTKSANNFKLMYGWKGDNDRAKWFDYQIQTQWSFFGGSEIATDWKDANTNIINLAAPYVLKTIELEADPELLKESKVRMVNVKVYYNVGGKEQVKQIALLPYKNQYSGTVEIFLPENDLKYDYEISWRLYGNQSKTSGRRSTTEPILFVDEL